jgi:predicted AlkP superfamily phosphohydrolase/phosphomutase
VYRPERLWRETRGIPPDLVVYFGDLAWRSNGSVGRGRHWTFENDTGPDDANHAPYGLCVTAGPGIPAEHREDMHIFGVAPKLLALFELEQPVGART